MRSGVRNLRTEVNADEVEAWFEEDFSGALGKYLAETYESPRDHYDFRVETLEDEADLRYRTSEDNGITDVYVEVTGGILAIDSAIEAFDKLWEDSYFYDDTDQQ